MTIVPKIPGLTCDQCHFQKAVEAAGQEEEVLNYQKSPPSVMLQEGWGYVKGVSNGVVSKVNTHPN